MRFEQLADADVEVGGELPEAVAALALPAGVQLAPGDDAVGHPLEHEIEPHRLDDAGDGRAEVGDGRLEVDRTARAGMGEEIGDVDAECAHAVAAWNERPWKREDAPVDGDRPPVGRTCAG